MLAKYNTSGLVCALDLTHMYLAFVSKLNYLKLLTNGRKEDSGCYVSFSTDSADQILSWMKKLIYDINQRKLFFQQIAKDTIK